MNDLGAFLRVFVCDPELTAEFSTELFIVFIRLVYTHENI